MKKYFCLSMVLFLCSMSFSQKPMRIPTQKDTLKYDFLWKVPIEEEDKKERQKAERYPIVRKIQDTLGSDYLEQHFYHNGNLYYQVTYKDGERTGFYEAYHPNGQLYVKQDKKNGNFLYDSCSYISYDRFGDTAAFSSCAIYNDTNYSFTTTLLWGKYAFLRIYSGGIMVAEYRWTGRKWEKHDYHCRSVEYANKLLRIYKKR